MLWIFELVAKSVLDPGPISAEDQALLDEIQSKSEALTTRLEALDQQTPPVAPPANP